LWTFADTLFHPQSVDGTNLRSNTAGWADPTQPLDVTEPLDANGTPAPLIAFTAEEQTYNDSSGAPDDRIALWPSSVISINDQTALVFYLKLKVQPGFLNYEFIGTGIAEVTRDGTAAVRDDALLFTVPEPTFDHANLIGSDVYVYGRLNAFGYAVARVPLAHIRERDAYRFWDGTDWVADVSESALVMRDIPGAVSVSYNEYLQTYIAVHSAVLSNTVVMRTADQPQGPWSEPVELFTGLIPDDSINYAGREHPELAQDNGRQIVVSYYHPQGMFYGELHLVDVVFDRSCS
jgi:hypothetical protein